MDSVLCSIGTRGRYDTTLPLALAAIINQTKRPDKVVIFDDNDNPRDVRNELIYRNLFQMMDIKGIKWEWLFAAKKGTHYNHQAANTMGYKWVWRMDDDAIPESDVLRSLLSFAIFSNAGAVGGSILTPPLLYQDTNPTGKIENINSEPNPQWRISPHGSKSSICIAHSCIELECMTTIWDCLEWPIERKHYLLMDCTKKDLDYLSFPMPSLGI